LAQGHRARQPVGAKLNDLPKYVVSTSGPSLQWANSGLLDGDLAEEVSALKATPGNEIQVHGSGSLIQALMALHLVDQYRLFVHPVVPGERHPAVRSKSDADRIHADRLCDDLARRHAALYEASGTPVHAAACVGEGV
jgi:dihydrofolate reductase